MPDPFDVTLLAAGTQTADGSGPSVDLQDTSPVERRAAQITLDVMGITGDGMGLLVVETARTLTGDGWSQIGTFEAVEEKGVRHLTVAGCCRYMRVRWLITGGDDLTVEIVAQAHVVYADIRAMGLYGMPPHAFKDVSDDAKATFLIGASDEADAYLEAGACLPLTAWGEGLTKHVARLAVADLVMHRGIQVDGTDEAFQLQRENAIDFFKAMRDGKIKAPRILDQTPETEETGGFVAGPVRRPT